MKADRKQIEKAIKEMNLFEGSKKALQAYRAEVKKINEQEKKLKETLEGLQAEHTANLLDQEITDDVSQLVYLNRQARDIIMETQVIESMLERLAEAKTETKLKYAPIIKDATYKDLSVKGKKYDLTDFATNIRYQFIEAVAEVGREMDTQYREIAPEILELFQDEAVLEVYPRMKYEFNREYWKPTIQLSEFLSESDLTYAKMGSITVAKPKDVK
ncbi:hypothetical protein WQ57_13910 [Mesobacillus campisalis]|uniref:Uncharacterized protein n=1 Tax=Mesobacillus campisalis TaxID=1408103 RepID=A0A0M2STS5_9BACI|nr:hypothetical protein [Mesobacillus campisalis]KKK37528.1 hypothetical protein WQ57_13910 [Mesobacillus campisalis]